MWCCMQLVQNFLLKHLISSFFSSSFTTKHRQNVCFRGPEAWTSVGAKLGLWGGWERTIHPIVASTSLMHRLVCGLAFSCSRRTWFIVIFGWGLWICSCNFLKVHTSYGHPEPVFNHIFGPCWCCLAVVPVISVLVTILLTTEPLSKLKSVAPYHTYFLHFCECLLYWSILQ